MDTFKKSNLIDVSDDIFVLCNPNLNELVSDKYANLSIIYFTDNLITTNSIKSLLNKNSVSKILVISNSKNKLKNEKVIFCSHITSHILRSLTNNIVIIIDINDSYDFLKFVINNFSNLLSLSKKLGLNLLYSHNNFAVICSVINNSTYYNDLLNCIKALLINNRSKQYEFIYDTVCDFLDSQFRTNNLCDFKNDQCVANRIQCTTHRTMGCCYSFNYSGFFELKVVKDVKLCQYMQNRTCTTKNITCKLFTCKYLKKKNIRFDTHKILLLDFFFNKKQHNIIQSNFFRTREEILQKLQEKNYDFYYWYLLRQKYRIKG